MSATVNSKNKERPQQVQEGKQYYVDTGIMGKHIVTLKRNSLPYYKWSMDTGPDFLKKEVWTDDGNAYHDDCGFNLIEFP